MSVKFNRVCITGRLAADAELFTFGNGGSVVKFRIGNDDSYFSRDKNDWVQRTVWIDVRQNFSSDWQESAKKLADKLQKGNEILIDGKLSYEEWEDKGGGGKRSKNLIVAERVHVISVPNRDGGDYEGGNQGGNQGGGGGRRNNSTWGGNSGNGGGNQGQNRGNSQNQGGGYDEGDSGGDSDEIPF